jgi:hypothetical protein
MDDTESDRELGRAPENEADLILLDEMKQQ